MTLTKWILVFTFFGLILYDWWAVTHGQKTESQVLLDWSLSSVTLPNLFGVLMGHWFWPRKKPLATGWMWVLPIWGVLGVWDSLSYGSHEWYRFPILWCLVGLPMGSYLWGQVR